MSAVDRSFRSPAGRGAFFATVIVLAPVVVIAVAAAARRQFDLPSIVVLVAVSGGLAWATSSAARTAAFVTCSPDHVTVGLAPFWRTRLVRRDIKTADLVQIDAYAEYGGWGIKGSARGSRGRLYSVGGDTAVRFMMQDGRTYVIAFTDGPTAGAVLEALNRQAHC